MNEQQLRKSAAELAKDLRKMERKGSWTISEWNSVVRNTVGIYMSNTRIFYKVNGDWNETQV